MDIFKKFNIFIILIYNCKCYTWYPIHNDDINLPEGVAPWLPTFSPDGNFIFFQNQYDGNFWIVKKSSKISKCITCKFKDMPANLDGGFTYGLSDNQRLLFSTKELSPLGGSNDITEYDAYILKCIHSLFYCRKHSIFPIDMSKDRVNNSILLQRRTWHVSPDERYLSWTNVRSDGFAMVIGQLNFYKNKNKYIVENIKVINPISTKNKAESTELNSQIWELKSFTDGGKSVLIMSSLKMNIDVYKLNLESGNLIRLTNNLDWDEDGAISSDESLQVLYSWRTRNRLNATSLVPIRNFASMQIIVGIFVVWISSWPGFQCDLSPWLISHVGDLNTSLIGQPLRIYNEDETCGNNLAGYPFWNDNEILLQGRLRKPVPSNYSESVKTKGLVPPKIMRVIIDKAFNRRKKAPTVIGDWAVNISDWKGVYENNEINITDQIGNINIKYYTSLFSKKTTVSFNNYSEDGTTFICGYIDSNLELKPTINHTSFLKINISISGENKGYILTNITRNINNSLEGTWISKYNKDVYSGIPEIGPCYEKLPKLTNMYIYQIKKKICVFANIYGDERPIQNAKVFTLIGLYGITDKNGCININMNKKKPITIIAGETFKPLFIF